MPPFIFYGIDNLQLMFTVIISMLDPHDKPAIDGFFPIHKSGKKTLVVSVNERLS